jgi:ECF transporter S component (folate family)
MFGPMAAVVMAVAADTVNYLIKPMGPYFPGYALSLAVSCLFYSFWQYNKPIALWRIAVAQLCTIVFVHFGLNLLWMGMVFGRTAGELYTWVRVVNNAVTFPFMAAGIYALSRAVVVLESRYVKKS